ncbi:MAG: hypothetical protein JST02_00465 [Bacteroidetes bacterium]|nr:hypothetical protein [Bacteroidota bacterium]
MQFTLSGQLIRQDAVNGGGNNDPAKSYFEANGKSFILGSSARLQVSQWDISFNYTRITKAGRFLFPREWGKEPLFTFLPRERSEGLGNVNAYMIKVKYDFEKARLAFESGSGLYILPTVSDFRYNKYGMTSYFQENILVEHTFSRKLEGMKASLLFVYKGKYGNDYVAAKNIINKVNVSLWSLQLNYLLHYSK